MNKENIDRITSLTNLIFDIYLLFIQKYILFRPLVHDKQLIKSYQTHRKRYAFGLLRYTLFSNCLLEISNICFDKSRKKNSPSIENILSELNKNDSLVETLKQLYSNSIIGTLNRKDGTFGPPYTNDEHQENIRRSDFDEKLRSLNTYWNNLTISPISSKIKSIRDKIVAHREIKFSNNNYELLLIDNFPITYREFETFTDRVKEIMILLQAVVRQSGFDYGSLDSFIEKNINGFWDKQ